MSEHTTGRRIIDRRSGIQGTLPPSVERRPSQCQTIDPSPSPPPTHAGYQQWLTQREVFRGLLLEIGEIRQTYGTAGGQEATFKSAHATRQKLADIERLIAEYEARPSHPPST